MRANADKAVPITIDANTISFTTRTEQTKDNASFMTTALSLFPMLKE